MRFPGTLTAAAVALTFAVTGCSSGESQPTSSIVEAAKPYNDADIAFATDRFSTTPRLSRCWT